MVMHDIAAIKRRLRISQLVDRDALHVARRGPKGLVVRCPFHEEKTASCHVHENNPDESWFHCFGCGAGGDVIKWHSLRTGAAFAEALADAAALAGIAPLDPAARPLIASPTPATTGPAIPVLAPALSQQDMAEWAECCDALLAHPGHLCAWRGYSHDTVRYLATTGMCGITRHPAGHKYGFLVERPNTLDDSDPFELVPVAVHHRVPPESGSKAFWFYQPKDCGAWPFILGNIETAKYILCFEGQWDAIAFADVTGWTKTGIPRNTCLVGMRGSHSFRTFIASYPYRKDARCLLFADADTAGRSWYARTTMANGDEKPSMAELLTPHVRDVHVWIPEGGAKDLNDLTKSGAFTADTARSLFIQHFQKDRRRPLKRHNLTLLQYVKSHTDTTSPERAEAAKFILSDTARPKGRPTFAQLARRYDKLIPDKDKLKHVMDIIAEWRPPRR